MRKRIIYVLLIISLATLPLINNIIPVKSDQTPLEAVTELKIPSVEPRFRNPWTPELEAQFQKRATFTINSFANPKNYGNTFGENEKRSYPSAMFDFLAGNRQKAIAFLETKDVQVSEHAHTEGIDYYFCFTLKGQIRKYFLLGSYLDPAYRQKMWLGAKKWTEKDPLTQPHPIYGTGSGTGVEWSVQRRGLWVDGRNTDNLRAMREVAVYLMAEETNNEATRQIYKAKLNRYVWALYNIGMGEWDSEVYHGHTFAAYLNLYDFAKDREVTQLAKAALDWMSAAAAVKYYHGSWAGPVKRDYGTGNKSLASGAASVFWLYFGDTGNLYPNPSLDALHVITSSYRPPLAVVALAQRQFKRPVEILSSKPLYENWKPGNDQQPGYWETQFLGESFQMGSIAAKFADGDLAPFKLLAENSTRGVDYLVANTGTSVTGPGKQPGDEIGQYRHLLIWLRPANQPFFWQVPKTAKIEIEAQVWFIQLEKTWLALYPINLKSPEIVPFGNSKLALQYDQEQILRALTKEGLYAGFALEVGEAASGINFEQFKQNVRKKGHLNLGELEKGTVTLQGTRKENLTLTYNLEDLLPIIRKNGRKYQWERNFALYNSLSKDKVPISLGWKQGKLRIKTDQYEFTSQK